MASSWDGIMATQMGWPAMDDGWRKGPWTAEEDKLLIDYVKEHGEGRWNSVSRITGLRRNGKSCRLRWVNYLRPDLKRGQITPEEEEVIVEMHARWGNRWSTIARSLPGRTDNEIKNYWRTHFKKKTKISTDNAEKLKARLLRKQHFQQQQQQLQLQQQQQQYEFNEFDLKKFMSMIETEENIGQVVPTSTFPQTETTTIGTNSTVMYPNTMECDDQSYFYPMLNSDASNSEGSNDQQPHDLAVWDELWGLDDVQGSFNALCAASKQANFMHHFVTPF
ncbi:hypothetical protein V2J09_014309 [Rumex salicifolius]